MTAYYNEIDPYAAEWLRNLIAAGHIAPGVVDTRSIEDVHPADLKDFTQCHFFAGIGVWSLALRRAGWSDDRPVWTGSCPCQPFSAAGQGAGFADERHLWPAFHHLIRQRRPAVVLGEQVASKDVEPWIDLVQDDLEGVGYRFGAVPFPSAGVGAPHIRDRLYWVADAESGRKPVGLRERGARASEQAGGRGAVDARRLADTARAGSPIECRDGAEPKGRAQGGSAGGLAFAGSERCEGLGLHVQPGQQGPAGTEAGRSIEVGRLADTIVLERSGGQTSVSDEHAARGWLEGATAAAGLRSDLPAGPTNGYWRDADWLGCRDEKWRPVEPGTFPLAHGATARVGRLRAYGNAINAEAARVFVEAVMEAA